jgi:hypothetical protein
MVLDGIENSWLGQLLVAVDQLMAPDDMGPPNDSDEESEPREDLAQFQENVEALLWLKTCLETTTSTIPASSSFHHQGRRRMMQKCLPSEPYLCPKIRTSTKIRSKTSPIAFPRMSPQEAVLGVTVAVVISIDL